MKLILVSCMMLALAVESASAQGDEGRMQLFDEQIVPYVEEMMKDGRPPSMQEMEDLATMVHRFNAMNKARMPKKEVVVLDMNPFSWRTMLNDLVPDTAAVAFCAESISGLNTCPKAAEHLKFMTAQCSQTVLALIDLDVDGDVPLSLFQEAYPNPGNPNFIMLKRREDNNGQLPPVRFFGSNSSPDAVALLLCPRESKSLGHVLRFTYP